MWNYSAGPVRGMGSKSTEKPDITQMYFFPFLSPALHLQITFVPLALYLCSMFHPPLQLTHTHSYWRFSISPLQPSSLLTLSLEISPRLYLAHFKWDWDSICPAPCRFASKFHSWCRHIIKLQNEQNIICQKFSSNWLFVISNICYFIMPEFVLRAQRGMGQMEVSVQKIKNRCCHPIGVEASRWFHCSKWQHRLIWPFNFKSNSVRLQHLQSPPVIQDKPPASSHKHTGRLSYPRTPSKAAFSLKPKLSRVPPWECKNPGRSL